MATSEARLCHSATMHWQRSLLMAFLVSTACSSSSDGSSGTNDDKCVEDVECPTGQGCFRGENQVSYCSPLCTKNSQCPDQIDCPTNKPMANQKSCVEPTAHKGQGVCSLYLDSSFDATNCAHAVVRCVSDRDSCYCYTAPTPGDVSRCTSNAYADGLCCADEGFPSNGICMCYSNRFGCEVGMLAVSSCGPGISVPSGARLNR